MLSYYKHTKSPFSIIQSYLLSIQEQTWQGICK